jgi:hypothetical protein
MSRKALALIWKNASRVTLRCAAIYSIDAQGSLMLVVRLGFSELHKIAVRSKCCNLSGQIGDVEKAFPDEWKGFRLRRAIIGLEQGGRESVFRIAVTKGSAM